ncbi:Alpha/beta hydrolase family-domain-containing protein [Crucibulum laeve]|uniref:Alpha/beta hydrolase family-domain-containing protein n=1 Tax=Crucibulum laeve TaxID=68775 RepID=A0A5C3LH38_9AGAR|nr:Alpha/beta hydrolase family-domain-containing protein [Crucibulum laeve]
MSSKFPSYLPLSSPETWTPVTTRIPLAVYPPPEPLTPPALPSPPRKPAFDAPYTLSTHIFPACYMRTTRHVPIPAPPPENATKAERHRILQETRVYLKDQRGSTVTDGYPCVLWNVANRYVRKGLDGCSKGITLFFAHANGFPKEIWEPAIGLLLSSRAGQIIDEVWSWESVQHGDAALLNEGNLSAIFDWSDNARDILNFLLFYLPTVASDTALPTHLQRLPNEETEYRESNGFKNRTIVPVGHSYGGCTSALAAIIHPQLFSSIVLVDPVIIKPTDDINSMLHDPHTSTLVLGSLTRRETWSSREEALASFQKSPFFCSWDPAVLRVYVECGIHLIPSPSSSSAPSTIAKLKTPGIQEAIVFSETHTEYETFQQMPTLDERIALHWVVPGKAGAGEFGPPGGTGRRVWVRPKNASNVRIPGAGHLVAQERPASLAEDLAEFLLQRYAPAQGKTALRANL